jgi:hypothetical protein
MTGRRRRDRYVYVSVLLPGSTWDLAEYDGPADAPNDPMKTLETGEGFSIGLVVE